MTISDSIFWISDISLPSTFSHEEGLSRKSRSDKSLYDDMSVSDGAVGLSSFLQLQQRSDLCFRVFQIPQPIATSIATEATNAIAHTANEMFSVGSVSSSLKVSESWTL